MRQNDCKENGKLWLYLDMSLSAEEKEKFEEHVKECVHCGTMLKEYAEAMELYRNNSVEVISEKDFEAAIANAVSDKKRKRFSIVEVLEGFFGTLLRHKMRAALGTTLIISGIVVSSLLQPNKTVIPERVFPAEEVMVWTNEAQATEVADIKNTIEYIAEEDEEKYLLQNYEEDVLTVALYDLDKDLIAIEEEIDQYNF